MNSTLTNNCNLLKTEALHFQFEEDFMENNIRCIPMVVRFKLDAAGVKLKLAEWSKFSVAERNQLTIKSCNDQNEINSYRKYLFQLVVLHTANEPVNLIVDNNPAWANCNEVNPSLQSKAKEHDWFISIPQWRSLSNLQRFALLKLYRPGHENKNFPRAMKEFGLV
jgi:hypothetical protein